MKYQGRKDDPDAMQKRNAKILKLADEGYLHKHIAERFGLTASRIEGIIFDERHKDEHK